jgi:nucleoside-diphosphate-sugar epimerase
MLLLGGNGLIGQHLVRAAEARGWEVTTVALHADVRRGVRAAQESDLPALVASGRWNTVVDLRAFDAPSTAIVVDAMPANSCYMLVSTIYAYCHPRTHLERDLRGLLENAPLTPSGPYGPGKVSAELVAMAGTSRWTYVVRLPFVFGSGDRTGRTELLCQWARVGCDPPGTSIELGLVPASLVADRLCELTSLRPDGRFVLNVDGGRNWTLREHLIAARHAFAGRRLGEPARELPFNPGRDYSLNSTTLHELLGIAPDDDIERGWRDVAC